MFVVGELIEFAIDGSDHSNTPSFDLFCEYILSLCEELSGLARDSLISLAGAILLPFLKTEVVDFAMLYSAHDEACVFAQQTHEELLLLW